MFEWKSHLLYNELTLSLLHLIVMTALIIFTLVALKTSLDPSFESSNITYNLLLHQIETHRNQSHPQKEINCTNNELDINTVCIAGTVLSQFKYLIFFFG